MQFSFTSELWLWPGGQAAWHFVNVPKEESRKIKEMMVGKLRGFGSVPVEATIGKTSWQTSIFPDKRSGTYLLPIKVSVRKAETLFDKSKTKIILKVI